MVVWWDYHSQESGADPRCVRLPPLFATLSLDAYNTKASVTVVGPWVLLGEPNEERQTEGIVEGSGHSSRLGHTFCKRKNIRIQ